MILPAPLRAEVEAALREHAPGDGAIVEIVPVGGGCVSPVARIATRSGARFFLKWATAEHPKGLLAAEARGLRTIAATRTVRVPEVVASSAPGSAEWLLLDWLEPGLGGPGDWERLGSDLARLHAHRAEAFGAPADNFIGPLPQANRRTEDWAEFWRSRRLEPQLRRAREAGGLTRPDVRRCERLLDRLEDPLAVARAEGPSLLHGDLWSGNVHMTAEGPPAVIDPSSYHGHREVDLAMAELFGGFGAPFGAAYREAWPLQEGYDPERRAIYQLYYLLVHVNLFGAAYLAGCRRALQAAGV